MPISWGWITFTCVRLGIWKSWEVWLEGACRGRCLCRE